MALPVELIIFAVRGAFRLGRATSLELQAHIRNSELELPKVLTTPRDPVDAVRDALDQAELSDEQTQRRDALLADWGAAEAGSATSLEIEGSIFAFAREVGLPEFADAGEEERGLVTIQQWSEKAQKEQVQPFVRIGLALVEVALDYATTNPGVFGVGSNGERFVRALASAVDEILPDSDKISAALKPEQIFGERAVAILAHNGLSALQEHISETVDEEHLRDLSVSILKPLVKNFENGEIQRKTLIEFRELALGPMAREAVSAIARHQRAFLGKRFGENEALGAVTNAILVTVATEKDASGKAIWSLESPLDREVWQKVYGSVLDVAIKRPELFGGESDAAGSAFGRDLVKTVAARLRDLKGSPFDESAAALIVADTIDVFGRNTAFLFDREKDATGKAVPWNAVAHDAVASVLGSISAGIKEGVADDGELSGKEVFKQVFSEDQAGALIRVVLDQAAKTPGMITGDAKRDEVKALVAGIARAVSDTNRNLLSSDDWLEVAAIVAEQAAQNPGRLFKIVGNDGKHVKPEEEFAVRLIGKVLGAAADDFRNRGRGSGSVLFGPTLKEVLRETIETAADNAAVVAKNEDAVIGLVNKINELQGASAQSFGHREWLRLFRGASKKVLLSDDGQAVLDGLQDLEALRTLASGEHRTGGNGE